VSATPAERTGLPERYEVRSHIANGGMASVWCAYDATLGREVAIKVLARQFLGDDHAIRRFKREARTAARLSAHPHVVVIYDVAEAAGRPYIVMEYLAGETVADAIRVGGVGRDQALRWLAEAASALDYAHGRGVVHCDIKPGNLLLSLDWRLHVADFGIARLAAEETFSGTGQLLGTAAYLPPEQALGQPASDASDRYALAVAAFELLVGQRPFTAEHFDVLARQHIEADPPRASSVNRTLPRAVDAVLARGMAKRPEDRWTTAGTFVDALDAAFSKPGRARRLTAVPPPPRRARRTAAVAALAAVCVAIGIVVAMPQQGVVRHARPSTTEARLSPPAPRRVHQPKPKPKSVAAPVGAAPTITASPTITSTPTTATTTSTSRAPSTTSSAATLPAPQRPAAAMLEARGHQLMLDGAYSAAIPILRQAIAAVSPGDVNYGYALYDLGRSLRLAGDPRAAIPVLERRLQIHNQMPVVRSELRQAQRAGTASRPAPRPATPSPPGHHHVPPGHHHVPPGHRHGHHAGGHQHD
jgi:eukaryotic-like serine/threonine-protein kinase